MIKNFGYKNFGFGTDLYGIENEYLPKDFQSYLDAERLVRELKRLNYSQKIIDAIDTGVTHFISGMAEGVNLLAAELVLDLKWDYPFISLECAIPFIGQQQRYYQNNYERYQRIIKRADKVTILSNQYFKGCLFERNKYMIDNSSILIAVFNGVKTGGTFQTIALAKKKNLEIWLVNC